MTEQDPFAGAQVMSDAIVAFSKPGDWVRGTYTSYKATTNKEGRPVKIYEFKGQSGTYHRSVTENDENGNKVTKIITPPETIVKGDYYKLWGGKDKIDDLFSRLKPGDIFVVQYEKAIPSKKAGNSAFKQFKTGVVGRDADYMGETSADYAVSDIENTVDDIAESTPF